MSVGCSLLLCELNSIARTIFAARTASLDAGCSVARHDAGGLGYARRLSEGFSSVVKVSGDFARLVLEFFKCVGQATSNYLPLLFS